MATGAQSAIAIARNKRSRPYFVSARLLYSTGPAAPPGSCPLYRRRRGKKKGRQRPPRKQATHNRLPCPDAPNGEASKAH